MNDAAAAADPRLPGPADRPGPVRLRLGDEVARRARADDARGVRRLLGPARLGQGGADPDPVADRHAARRRQRRARSRSPASPGRRTAASRKVEVAIDGDVARGAAVDADLERDLGPVGRRLGRRRPGEHTIEVRATDGTGEVQTEQRRRRPRPTAPAAGTRSRCTSADRTRGRLRAEFGIESGHATTPLPLRPTRPLRGRHDRPSPATARSSSRPATAPRVVSVVLEKVQVAVLADRLGDLLAELERRGVRGRRGRRDGASPRTRRRSTSRSTRRSGPAR